MARGFENLFNAAEQLREIKEDIVLGDLPRWLRQNGWDPDDKVLVTQKGRQSRRTIRTLSPRFFEIGTTSRPTTVRTIGGDMREVANAANWLIDHLRRISPRLTGEYAMSFVLSVARRAVDRVRPDVLEPDSVVSIVNAADYASTIEKGFYRKYYRTRPALQGKGIMWQAHEDARRRFDGVAIRFGYLGGGRENLPVIDIAAEGVILENSTRPGSRRRRRRR